MKKKDAIYKRKGQEEMVGFVLIIVLVMIIILVFLGFSVNKNKVEGIQSYEVDSFLQAMKQYTTKCSLSTPYDYRNIVHLIKDCRQGRDCYNSQNSCEVLEEELRGIVNSSWSSDDRGNLKGYSLSIIDDKETIINITSGNITKNYIGPTKNIKDELKIDLRIYQ